MEWFSTWWNNFEMIEQVLLCIALPATLILIVQVIMMIAGFGGGGEGIEFSDTSGIEGFDVGDGGVGDVGDIGDISDISDSSIGDGSVPGDFSIMSIFSIQGIISFLCVFSWSGLAFYNTGLHVALSMIIAIALGFLAMLGVATVIRLSARLAQNGTLNIKILLGETATVYVPIPPNKEGHGKVTVQLSERFVEMEAVTEEEDILATNSSVRITDILAGNLLVVEKIN